MNGTEISRESFFGMAGLTENVVSSEVQAYTPVSLGKGAKVRNGNASWIANLKKVDFTDASQLRLLAPENVTATEVYVNNEVQNKYRAIVGDNTHKVYSIKSNKYQPVQNRLLVDSLAQVSDDTGIQVFGKMNDEGGRCSINAFFADPNCNIDFGEYHGGKGSDPYMLGVRAYNSHTGQTGFGAEIIGVRWLCSNMVAFGDILGKVYWKHLVKSEDVISQVAGMITGYMDKVPILKKKVDEMKSEILTLDEAECALWGIKISPFKTESIMAHLPELNPEIIGKNGKVSVYDVFNATTAYNTHSNTGGSEFGHTDFSKRAQNLITDIHRIDEIIADGREARTEYEENLKMNASNTVLVSD